jgi:hypothetical protein
MTCSCVTHLGDNHFPCSQQARPDSTDCYFHGKMRYGLVEPEIGANSSNRKRTKVTVTSGSEQVYP